MLHSCSILETLVCVQCAKGVAMKYYQVSASSSHQFSSLFIPNVIIAQTQVKLNKKL